jgi:hypothetical protein
MDRDEAIRLLTGGPDLIRGRNKRRERHEIIPDLTSVPVQPLILASQTEYKTFEEDIRRNRPWVLKPFRYWDSKHAIASLHAA